VKHSDVDALRPELLDALQAVGVDPAELTGPRRRYVAKRLRAIVEALPARDGPNRATVRELLALCDVLERAPET
jgi:hypothetical protein